MIKLFIGFSLLVFAQFICLLAIVHYLRVRRRWRRFSSRVWRARPAVLYRVDDHGFIHLLVRL